MALSQVQVACAGYEGDADPEAYFTVGPLQGPSVVRRVLYAAQSTGSSGWYVRLGVVRSPEATSANFDSGVSLIRNPVQVSADLGQDRFWDASDSVESTQFTIPAWVPMDVGAYYGIVHIDNFFGGSLKEVMVCFEAEVLHLDPSGRGVVVSGLAGPRESLIDALRRRATQARSAS